MYSALSRIGILFSSLLVSSVFGTAAFAGPVATSAAKLAASSSAGMDLSGMAGSTSPTQAPLEERVHFSYSTSDGEFQLSCKHWIANEGAGDFSVICGKGTPTVKEYSVHLVVREHPRATKTSFEILYWVTDRNTKASVPDFKSHSQIINVAGSTKLQSFSMSQGLENDASFLQLEYKP